MFFFPRGVWLVLYYGEQETDLREDIEMAMTKKEQEQVRALEEKLSILAALRWTEEVKPDIPIPEWEEGLTKGWTPLYNRVEKACSSSVSHGTGQWDKTTSQQPLALYSSALLALKALRHEMELRLAKALAQVDRQIEKAKEESPNDRP